MLASAVLREFDAFDTQNEAKKNVVAAIKRVASQLGNTPAVCRKCYVHPAVLERYLGGGAMNAVKQAVVDAREDRFALRPEEVALLDLLSERMKVAA